MVSKRKAEGCNIKRIGDECQTGYRRTNSMDYPFALPLPFFGRKDSSEDSSELIKLMRLICRCIMYKNNNQFVGKLFPSSLRAIVSCALCLLSYCFPSMLSILGKIYPLVSPSLCRLKRWDILNFGMTLHTYICNQLDRLKKWDEMHQEPKAYPEILRHTVPIKI